MKILVCTDGSEHSLKALEKAAMIGEGCNVEEVAIIYVHDGTADISLYSQENLSSTQQVERVRKMIEQHEEESKKVLPQALKVFEGRNIKVRTIYEEGHPAHTIARVAEEEGFDMVVIGSRGLSGLKKMYLGSVSNAVMQEAKNSSVLVVR